MSLEKTVKYTNAKDSDQVDLFKYHKFEIKDGERLLSSAEVKFLSKPLPHYLVADLYTEPGFQNMGLASKVLDSIEQFLRERDKPGVLIDLVMSDIPEVRLMYERRGWELLNERNLRAFNLSPEIDRSIFRGYQERHIFKAD